MASKSRKHGDKGRSSDMPRSEGDTGVPQRGRTVDDPNDFNDPSVSQAMESGEPGIAGRSHGMVIDGDGAPAGERDETLNGDADSDYESGRHDAAQS